VTKVIVLLDKLSRPFVHCAENAFVCPRAVEISEPSVRFLRSMGQA